MPDDPNVTEEPTPQEDEEEVAETEEPQEAEPETGSPDADALQPDDYREQLQQVLDQASLSSSGGLAFHIVRVGSDCMMTTHSNLADFRKAAERMLVELAGQPYRLFFFYGWHIQHTTPQVMVGLKMPGAKPQALVLKRQGDNETGDVPHLDLSDT